MPTKTMAVSHATSRERSDLAGRSSGASSTSAESDYVVPPRRGQGLGWLCVALLAAAFAHNLTVGWRRWGDLVVDGGRELEVARQLAGGARLYADVRYYYGPLAPYLDAALFRLFGARVGVLMAAGIAAAALMCTLLYALGTRLAGRLAGLLVAAAFLYLCAFAHLLVQGGYNWVLPYANPATYGMLAATASLYFLLRHVSGGRPVDLALSSAGLALAALAKLEAVAPVAVAHATFLGLRWHVRRPPLAPYVVAGLAVGTVYARFAGIAGETGLGGNLGALLNPRAVPGILGVMGLTPLPLTAAALVQSALAQAAVLLAMGSAAWLARRPDGGWQARLAAAVLCTAVPLAVYAIIPLQRTLRFLPVLTALLLADGLRRWVRAPEGREARLPLILLFAFALASLARMPLSTGAMHYGFYLLPVPLVVLAVFWFRLVPHGLAARGAPAWVGVWTGTAMLVVIVARHHHESRALYARHTVHVQAPRGELYLLADVQGHRVGEVYAEAIRRLATLPAETRVLALPQGVGLGFLAGVRSWDGMHAFLPPEVPTPADDARLVTRLEREPPDVVLWIGLGVEEYGSAGFGVDYAKETLSWVRARYHTVAALGEERLVLVMLPNVADAR